MSTNSYINIKIQNGSVKLIETNGIEALHDVVQNLDESINEGDVGDVYFSNPDYEILPLQVDKIKEIKSSDSLGKMAFIDGGNQEILGAPNFSVQVNRIYFCLFKGKERVHPKQLINKIEFFSATHSTFRNGKIYYDTQLFPIGKNSVDFLPDRKDLSFDSTDRTVTIGTQRADITRVASIARRFAEWKFASLVVENEMEKGDFLVADGSLDAAFTNEPEYLKKLFLIGKKKGVIITGLSKTSRLFTTSGLSLLGAIQQIAEPITYEKWYIPLAKSKSITHEVAIFAVQLNKFAERVFRFEVQRDQFKDLEETEFQNILNQLALNSSDISFAGYPYGLVDGDTFARVREEEVSYYKAILMSEISKAGKWKKFSRHIKSIDSHDYLNTVIG